MQIFSTKFKQKCDMGGCKNYAVHSLRARAGVKGEISLCDECAKEIYGLLAAEITPKSPVNAIAKKQNEGTITPPVAKKENSLQEVNAHEKTKKRRD